MKRAKPTVVLNRRTWNQLRPYVRLGTLDELPTKADAIKKALELRRQETIKPDRLTVAEAIRLYREERIPTLLSRQSSINSRNVWLRQIDTKFGSRLLEEVRAREVELWVNSLKHLAPRSRGHLRTALSVLWDYALWAELVPKQINPMSLVLVKGCKTVEVRPAVKITVEQFRQWLSHLEPVVRVMAMVQAVLGLRICELQGLKWLDINWLGSEIELKRAMVKQVEGGVKTRKSGKPLPMTPALLAILKQWKQVTDFAGAEDWIFTSPWSAGRLPYSYTFINDAYSEAAHKIGLARLGTHALRHGCRSFLRALGVDAEVQKEYMRHEKLPETEGYGAILGDEEAQAQAKLIELILPVIPSGYPLV